MSESKKRVLPATLLCVTLGATCLGAESTSFAPSAIVVGRYVAPDGSLQSPTAFVIVDGKIKTQLAAARFSETDNVARYPDGVLCPGLVDVYATLGAHGSATESVAAIDPGASVMDGLDLNHRDFRRAVEAGITTALIAPSPNNLVSGSSAVVKTADVPGHERILRREGPLMLALGPPVWQRDRAPTSRTGSMVMLREALAQARRGKGHEEFRAFAYGKTEGMVVCDEATDAEAAMTAFAQYGLRPTVIFQGDLSRLLETVRVTQPSMVVGPLVLGAPERVLSGPAMLAEAGLPVTLSGRTPQASFDGLRISAALATRHGLDPRTARMAITLNPARVAGVADRVGSIEMGKDADFVVFSDDPLRLDARVLAVYIDGVRVYAERSNGE